MAINFDHTNSASITLKGPDAAQQNDNFTFVFPNVTSVQSPTLLISGETPISAISGLVSALSQKVEKSTTGSAATLNYGTSVGNVVQLDSNAKIPDSLISSVAIRDVFSVNDFSELTSNSAASVGDVGIVANENKNYILCSSGAGDYACSSYWKEVLFPVQTVTCVNGYVGDVVLNASDINVSVSGPAAYQGFSVDYALSDLSTVKANLSDLISYATTGYVADALADYTTTTDLTTCLNGYVTDNELSTVLMDYSTTSEINTTLEDYVPQIETGSAASLTVGVSAGNVVQLNNDAKIPSEVLPSLAITDTFVVNTSGDLTSLTSAQKGDVAIATGDNRNYILKETDYSDINHWAAFAASVGSITGINGLAPVESSITLTSSDILVADSDTQYDSETISYAISGLDARISSIESDYLTESEASTLLGDYVTTGVASGIFDTKSDNGHGHAISDVTGLADCLASITVFCSGDGAYSAVLQSSANPYYNQACASYSVALGQGAKAIQDYEIAQGAGLIGGVVGSAQSSKLIAKYETTTVDPTAIAEICMENYSNILFSSYIVGRGPNKYAAFRVNGSANKEGSNASTQIVGDISVDTYVNTDSAYSVTAEANTTDGKIEIVVVADGSDAMQWVTNTSVTKVLWD